MESVCNFKENDRIRVCSSVAEVLNRAGFLQKYTLNVNYVKVFQQCVVKNVQTENVYCSVQIVPYVANDPHFYGLADARLPATVSFHVDVASASFKHWSYA